MKRKITTYVSETHMLSIFAGRNIELPFRFQPSVTFILDFDSYKKFCDIVLKTKLFCLTKQFKSLYRPALLNNDDTMLTRLYYYDISQVVLDEIVLSMNIGRDGTVMLHNFENYTCDKVLNLDDIEAELSLVNSDLLRKSLMEFHSFLPNGSYNANLTEHNRKLFSYALFLRSLSFYKNPMKFKMEVDNNGE